MHNTLNIKGGDVKEVRIYNTLGQQVLFIKDSNEISVESLADGVYFVKISDGDNVIIKKIAKR